MAEPTLNRFPISSVVFLSDPSSTSLPDPARHEQEAGNLVQSSIWIERALASSPKTDPVGVRESFRAAGPERILLDESETTYGGTISGNTATGNNHDGFSVFEFNDGTISGNTASSNASDGFLVVNFNDGTLSDNTATTNNSDGFKVSTLTGGTISENTATSNFDDGFEVVKFYSGTLSDNTASGNGREGFWVGIFDDGTMSGNMATENSRDGFAVGNEFDDGFSVSNTATFMSNVSRTNAVKGYDIVGTPASGSGTNTGSGNSSHDSY